MTSKEYKGMMQDIRHQYNKKMRKDREFKIRRNERKQTLEESLLLRDAEKKALAKKIQKKWKLAYYGNEMFYDFDEYMRQLVRDLGS